MWHPESIYDASGHVDEGVLHAWLDGELEPATGTELEAHAARCAACAARVAEARGLVAGASRILSGLDDVAGVAPSLKVGIVGRGERAGGPVPAEPVHADAGPGLAPRFRQPGRRWTTRRLGLAAAAAFVFVAGVVVLRDGDWNEGSRSSASRPEAMAESPGSVQMDQAVSADSTTVTSTAAVDPMRAGGARDQAAPAAAAGGRVPEPRALAQLESGNSAPPPPAVAPAPAPALAVAPGQAAGRAGVTPQVGGSGSAEGYTRALAERSASRRAVAIDTEVSRRDVSGADSRAVAQEARAAIGASAAAAPARAPAESRTRGQVEPHLRGDVLSAAVVAKADQPGFSPETDSGMAGCWRVGRSDSTLLLQSPRPAGDTVPPLLEAAISHGEGELSSARSRARLRWSADSGTVVVEVSPARAESGAVERAVAPAPGGRLLRFSRASLSRVACGP